MGCQIVRSSSVVEPKTIQPNNEKKDISQKITQNEKSETRVENQNSSKQSQTLFQPTQVPNGIDSEDLTLYPQTTDNLQLFIKLGLKRKSINFQTRKKYPNILVEITNLIHMNSLKFSNLQSICQTQNINIMDVMFIRNNSDETILTLILTYIDDYEIITELIINHKLPEDNYELLDLAISLLRKFRPQTSIDKIQKSIDFLDTVQQYEQLQKVFNSFDDPKIYRIQNAIMYAQNCISYFNHKKWIHLLLLRKLAKLFKQQFGGLFLKQYKKWKQGFVFNQLKVPKAIPKTTSTVTNLIKIELETLNYNLFHEIAIRQNWELFLQYSNPYYHQKSLDQRTPFWIFFQKAPISIIVDYIQQYPKELEQNIVIITKQGLTLIHCLCKNLNLQQSDQEIVDKLIHILENKKDIKFLLNVAYCDQIPLVYYLDAQKVIQPVMINFLSSSLIKKFDFDKLEIESYQIADQILNGKLSLSETQPHFKLLSKKQQKIVKKQWLMQKDEYVKQSNQYQNFTEFYQHYIQLAKQIIKNNVFDQFPWVDKYSLYSSHFPFDIGNIRTSLLYTLLTNNRFQQFQIQIESICKSIESLQLQPQNNSQEYQNLVQQLSRLLFIYQELFNYSEFQQQQLLISDTIYNKIKQNPEIILNKIYGFQKDESMAGNIFLQYIMRIKADKELYNKFINILLERLDKNLFKGKIIKIKLQFQNYNNSERYNIPCLKKLIPQQDQLIIPLEVQTQNIIEDSLVSGENFQNYYDFKNLIQEIMDKDNQFNFFINNKTVILRSNQLLQILLDKNSKLHQLYRQSFFNIKAMWQTSQFIKYNMEQIIPYILDQQNTIIKITSIERRQFEQLFDWQLYGMKVKFQINIKQIQEKLSLKEQVIYNQLKNKQEFWINLIIYDEFNTQVIEYFNRIQEKDPFDELNTEDIECLKRVQEKDRLITFSYFPLSEIISNNSYKNLQSLIKLKNITQYELIQILAEQFFIRQTSVVFYKPIKEKISLFNVQMRQLIAQIPTTTYEVVTLRICTLDKFINYLEIDTISRFNKQVLFNLIKESNIQNLISKCLLYYQVRSKVYYFSIEWQDQILQIIFDNINDNLEQLHTDFFQGNLKFAQKSPVVAKWMLQKQISQDKQDWNFKTNPLYFYSIFCPNEVYEWLDKIKLQFWMKRFLFGYFINLDQKLYPNKQKLIFKMISIIGSDGSKQFISNIKDYDSFFNDNRLFTWNQNGANKIYSTEKNKVFQKNQFKYRSEELKYLNVIDYSYYMILSKQEYQGFIDTINLNEEQYLNQIQFFILAGLNDKLQVIFNKIQSNESLQQIYKAQIFAKKKCLEHEFGFQLDVEFQFQIEEQRQFPQHFSFQKSECDFMNYKQAIDYIGTFKYLKEELNKKKDQQSLSNEITQINAILDSLIFPNTEKIQLNQQLINILTQLYINRKSNSKYQYKEKLNLKFSEFLAQRSDLYIKLLGANIQNCEVKFTKVHYFTQFQCAFFEQLLLLLSQDKNKVKYDANQIAKLILKNNLKNEQFNKIIQNGATNINYINQIHKYYFKKCNLLKNIAFNQQQNYYKAKLNFLQTCMSIDKFSFDNLQMNEIAFILKTHEFFDNKLVFNQNYLVASLLSNNLDTIIFAMELHKDPVKLGFEQNIFQILTIYSNEKDIITYYNKYVYKKVTDNKRLFSLNNVPLLYYIAFKRYSRVFFEVYLKQLQLNQNENEINKFITEQLQSNCFESNQKIYQLALEQKSYFLLNYMKSFIKPEDIETHIYNYDFNILNTIQSYSIQPQIIKEFIKLYLETQKFHKYFHKLEIKLPEKENIVLDNQNKAREDQIILLIKKEQATLLKIFGFNEEILKFVKIHQGFSFFIFELVIDQLIRYNGNPLIIQDYIKYNQSQNKTINKDIIIRIIQQVQQIYILDHPVFQQIIQLYPKELQDTLNPQNFILENSLTLALSQSKEKSMSDFISKQFKELSINQDEEQIDGNILFMMKLINQSSFNLDEYEILQDQILNLPEQILLPTIQFLNQNNSYQKKEMPQNNRDFLMQLMSKHIIISSQSQFWNIVSISKDYIPFFSEILYLKKIEKLCQQLLKSLNYFDLLENEKLIEFIIKFENVQMSLSGNQIYLPLEHNKDELFFSQEQYNKLIEQLKQIRLEKNIKENIETILNIKEYSQNNIIGELEGNYQIDDLEAPHLGQQNAIQRQVTQLEKQQTMFERKQTENPNQKQLKQEDIQFMKQNYDFMLELVNNNNYKVRDQKQNNAQIIFMEYYHFFNPKELIVQLEQCTESEFIRKYNGRESISFVLSQFYQYHENLKQAISNEDYKQWQINFPYYIKDDKFYSEKSLFSTYTIQVVFQKLHEFHENVKQYATNLGDVEKIQWRISAISTLEVLVSNLIDFNMYDNKPVDILSLLDSILNWSSLKMILLQVLYCNMLKYQNILSVLRRIYVEFNEIQEIPFENTFQEGGLDQYFRFGQTHYFLQQQTLVVRLNIIKKQPQLKQQISINLKNQSYNFLKQQEIDYYYCNIVNEEDLLFQIFNSQQIIQYLFSKLDVDRKLQQISQNLSKILNKDVIISLNHQTLLNILQSEIQQIRVLKDRKQQLRMQTQIKELLIKLSEFFLFQSEQLLIEQLQSHTFEYQFQTKLSSLLHSLRQGFNRSQDEMPNHRKIVAVQKAKVITKIRYPNKNCDKLISLYFGFQLKTNYFISKNKIGDLLLVIYKNEYQYLQTMLCQLVDNSRQGKLVFYQFDDSSVSTLSQEQLEQYCAMSNKMRKDQCEDDQIGIIDNENLIAVILFEKGWPEDSDFINNLINLYITDQNGNLYFILEQRLTKKMIQIQESDSESIRQQLLDVAFGKNQVQTYSSFTVSEIIPIFPNQIIYEFESGKFKQSKGQQNIENSQKMIIKINDVDFQIDKLKLDLLNIACYFDSNDIAQNHIKQLTQFKESHNELSKTQMIIKFSDDLNSNPSYYLDNIMQSQIAFVEFQQGYDTFFLDKFIPQIDNALSFMFDINQSQIKKNLIMSIFKIIEFTFDLKAENNNQLITFEKGVLKLQTFLIEKPNKTVSIEVPSANKFGQFLNQLIINFTQYNFSDLLMEKTKFEITLDQNYDKEFEQEILILILITKYLHKLISIKNDKKIQFKITKHNSKSISLYQFSKDKNEVQLFYDRFQDFRLEDFLLDYLNNYTNQYTISYNEFDKKILSKNQLMMQSMILSVDDFIKKEKRQVQQYELNISYGEQKIKRLEGRLDPRDFVTAFIIVKEQIYQKVICIKSQEKYSPLAQYFKQNSLEQKCGFPIYLLINGVYEYISLDEQLSKIKIITKNNVEKPLTFYKNYSSTLKAKVKFITSNILFVEFNSSKPLELTIKSNQYQIACVKQEFNSEIKIKFLPKLDSEMHKYYHTGIWFQNEFKQVNKEEQQNKIKENISNTSKLLKIILKSLQINEDMKIEKNQQNINLNQILNNNVLNIQSKQLINQSTKVGSERLDVIEIKDNFGNKSTNFKLQSIVLVHSIYQKIQIVPKYTKEEIGLRVYWEPQIKGIYYLYINSQKVDSYFVVLANSVDIEQSKVDIPEKLKNIPYYQEITFGVYLKDKLQNIFGSVENSLDMVKLEVVSSHKKSNIEQNYTKLSLEGKIEVTLRILPIEEDNVEEKDEIELILNINDKEKMRKQLFLEGVSFEKNMQDFQRSIFYDNDGKKIYVVEKQLIIARSNFLDSLMKLKEDKLKGPLMIKFMNEAGYDSGGLRKEFYNLIGNELKGENLKSEQYGYFSMLAPGYYFIDARFLLIPKKSDLAFVFGKFVANSIFNNHQIGIQFQPQFWKVIFQEKIQFKDLNGFLDPITFQNYESLLQYDDKTIESLFLNFIYQKKKEQILLIPDGQNVMVSKENCQIYLDKIAEYLIQTQYQDIYTPFIQGFSTVLDIQNLKKYFKPNDMGLITLGIQDIKPEQLANMMKFKGGQDYHISFFNTYVNSLNSKKLKELLQYITGTPTLPTNAKFSIQVEFKSDLKETLIPTTRTCFNTIEIPLYKTYAEMKKNMDIAISYGLIGFGIF